MQVRVRRSELATPASNWKMIEKAAASEADLVFLDLEDAVAPPKKVESRANVIRALNELEWGRTLRAVRVNDVETRARSGRSCGREARSSDRAESEGPSRRVVL
jgi:citrate lyase subunit beta/citryl-CoA lyase